LGEVHYFIQEESVGSGIIFILLLSVLNHFRNFKMAESCFFLHKISSRGNKTSPRCLDGWTIYSNGIGDTQVKPCSLINQLQKSVVFKLDLQWNQMILTVIFGFLVCCILMPNSI
jgi:hypothetical protein